MGHISDVWDITVVWDLTVVWDITVGLDITTFGGRPRYVTVAMKAV